ncbi:MAG TPA: flavodoxin domain-containing protein [Xanthobacteraceae bacterium]|nr:flavodoxin domain-containing protein [Xanthobacteraceae bacterium]
MPRILVLYGTSEGQTAKIARALAARLTGGGIEADVVRAGMGDPEPAAYDGLIVAASMHARGYQKPVGKWLRSHVADLNVLPPAFLSVCLSVRSKLETSRDEARAIPRRYVDGIGWTPTKIKVVAGAMPYTRYNFIIRLIMRRNAAVEGGDTDTTRDYEYTDWQDLRAFADRFAAVVNARRHAA